MMPPPDMTVQIGKLNLKNPVMTASGTFGYAMEFSELMDVNRLGAVVLKGMSLTASRGNPPPRIVETASGMLNAIGLENVGLENFILKKLPFIKTLSTAVIINIYGRQVSDYAELAARLNDLEGIAGIEVNISCPNVKTGGIAFGVDPIAAYEVIHAVRTQTTLPVIAKLSPNVSDITVIARSVVDAGADAVSLINTLTGMAIDIETRRSKLANITGGLSGPAIKPVALRMVWQTANAVSVPVIGIGGIMTASDALEFIIAGASAIQVGTASFVNPRAAMDILDGIESWLKEKQITRLADLRGTLHSGH
ncbi:MAG: dihydroorotate dehydrogenase [Desulfatirhabdiaceae bacterium]